MGQINQQQNNADGRSNRLRTLNEYRDAINELMSENMQTHHRYAAHAIGAESLDCTGCARYQILVHIENIIRGFINDEIMHNQHLTLTSMTAITIRSLMSGAHSKFIGPRALIGRGNYLRCTMVPTA